MKLTNLVLICISAQKMDFVEPPPSIVAKVVSQTVTISSDVMQTIPVEKDAGKQLSNIMPTLGLASDTDLILPIT